LVDNPLEKGANIVHTEGKWYTSLMVQWTLWIAIPLAIGIAITAAIPRPIIGTIFLRDAIYPDTAKNILAEISYAREHPEVRGVVLVLDSPGGTVADTESIYLELARLRMQKPVVAVIESMAASGAYYLAVGTDHIFTKPSSEVGNVGVRTLLPTDPQAYEEAASTGPFKFTGGSRDNALRSLEPIKQGFYQAIVVGRGSALKADESTVLSGALFTGTEAIRLGLADAIGTQTDGVEYAASLAHVSNFESADLRELAGIPDITGIFFLLAPDGSTTGYPREAGIYMLYIPPSERRQP
jgi:protease IV